MYEALEELCTEDPRLAAFRDTGLERGEALRKDIAWLVETYPDAVVASAPNASEDPRTEGEGNRSKIPLPSEKGIEYATFLREVTKTSLPAFMCHFYNHYFAHSAGGRAIGRKVAQR